MPLKSLLFLPGILIVLPTKTYLLPFKSLLFSDKFSDNKIHKRHNSTFEVKVEWVEGFWLEVLGNHTNTKFHLVFAPFFYEVVKNYAETGEDNLPVNFHMKVYKDTYKEQLFRKSGRGAVIY